MKKGSRKFYHAGLIKREDYAARVTEFILIMKTNKLTLEDLVADTPWIQDYLSAYRNLRDIWQVKTNSGFKDIALLGFTNSVIYRLRESVTEDFIKNFGKIPQIMPVTRSHIIKIDPEKILTLPVENGEIRYENMNHAWHFATDLLVNHPEKFLTFLGYTYAPDQADPGKTFTTTQAFCGVAKDAKRVTTIEYSEWACALMPVSASFLMREKVCKKQPIQGKLDMK